jgi:putative AlgH/UPF0301 family transcriptional regulator
MTGQPQYLSGKLLLAMPGMADPRFERAVIAMAVHDENGAVGIGIGHVRTGIRFRALLKQLDIDPYGAPDAPVLHGGPVEPGRGFLGAVPRSFAARHIASSAASPERSTVTGITKFHSTTVILRASRPNRMIFNCSISTEMRLVS